MEITDHVSEHPRIYIHVAFGTGLRRTRSRYGRPVAARSCVRQPNVVTAPGTMGRTVGGMTASSRAGEVPTPRRRPTDEIVVKYWADNEAGGSSPTYICA